MVYVAPKITKFNAAMIKMALITIVEADSLPMVPVKYTVTIIQKWLIK